MYHLRHHRTWIPLVLHRYHTMIFHFKTLIRSQTVLKTIFTRCLNQSSLRTTSIISPIRQNQFKTIRGIYLPETKCSSKSSLSPTHVQRIQCLQELSKAKQKLILRIFLVRQKSMVSQPNVRQIKTHLETKLCPPPAAESPLSPRPVAKLIICLLVP